MKCKDTIALRHEVKENERKETQSSRPYLHLLSFTNIFMVVRWRGQPHITEGQLSLWLPAVARQDRDTTQTR